MVRYSLWLALACLLVPSVLLSQGLNSHSLSLDRVLSFFNCTLTAPVSGAGIAS